MKKIFSVFMLIILLNSFLVQGVDWDSEDAILDENFLNNFRADPVGGFVHAPDKSWETLENDPALMEDPKIADAAFKSDPVKASEVLDKNPDLLENEEVSTKFNDAISKKISLLNDNLELKKKWFSIRGIELPDPNVPIEKYWIRNVEGTDQEYIKTEGFARPGSSVPLHRVKLIDTVGRVMLEEGLVVSGSDVIEVIIPAEGGSPERKFYDINKGEVFTQYASDVNFIARNGAEMYSSDGSVVYRSVPPGLYLPAGVNRPAGYSRPSNSILAVIKGNEKDPIIQGGELQPERKHPLLVDLRRDPIFRGWKPGEEPNTECENCVGLDVVINHFEKNNPKKTFEGLFAAISGAKADFIAKIQPPDNSEDPTNVADLQSIHPIAEVEVISQDSKKIVGGIYDVTSKNPSNPVADYLEEEFVDKPIELVKTVVSIPISILKSIGGMFDSIVESKSPSEEVAELP
ncbi:hypothetical protein ISS07_01115 [Candidatus Woesearchaeota archaeon]|nr:hypothetical protein [Candidatus Woesearchaeota archaeon]